jgi:hypothetical protein
LNNKKLETIVTQKNMKEFFSYQNSDFTW